MVSLTLLALLGAGTAVMPISRHADFPAAKDLELAARISSELAEQGVEISVPPAELDGALAKAGAPSLSSCEGHKECLPSLGQKLGLAAVVGQEASQVGGDLAIRLEALSVVDGHRLAKHRFVVAAPGTAADLKRELAPFVRTLLEALDRLSPARPDAPLAAEAPRLTPTVPPPHLETARSPLVFVAGGSAVAAGIAAGALVGLGAQQQNDLAITGTTPAGQRFSSLTRAQAQARMDGANGLYTGAAVAGSVALALGVATVVALMR
jgi:hypothetical protein